MQLNSTVIHHAVKFAWTTFKKHYRFLIAILLTIFVAWIALEIIVIAGQQLGVLWWTVAHLVFFFVFAGIELGFVQACFALYDGKEPTFIDTFGYLPLGLNFLAGQVLYLLITLIGLAFFIIPGVYLGVRYTFISFCQVAGQESLSQSFKQSATLSTGNKAYLLAIIGSLLIFNLLGACLLGIGLFITIPLSTLTMTAIYKEVSKQ